eukprot:3954316-Prymnesium_polylepis.2
MRIAGMRCAVLNHRCSNRKVLLTSSNAASGERSPRRSDSSHRASGWGALRSSRDHDRIEAPEDAAAPSVRRPFTMMCIVAASTPPANGCT